MSNKTIRCIAVDDEPIALKKLESYISRCPELKLVAACDSAVAALKVIGAEEVDAMFVDINMPDLTGMQLASLLQSPPMIVFTTAYSEYAVESYKYSAVDYLLKPFDFADFQRAVAKLADRMEEKTEAAKAPEMPDYILVKDGYKYVNITLSDITYLQGMRDYVQIHLADGSQVMAYTSMRQMADRLPSDFMQIHRSYIVNMARIKGVERMRVVIDDKTLLPVGDNYRQTFIDFLQSHSLEK